MTKKQFMRNLKEMLADDKKFVIEQAERLLKSQAIDLKAHENNFRLPKVVYYAVLHELITQRAPLNDTDREAAENLRNF